VFRENAPTTRQDIMVTTLQPEPRAQQPSQGFGEPRPLIRTNFQERTAEISLDGRWLAYESDESGRLEVYVRPFPEVNDGRWQVSTTGGRMPLWARNGRELFYLAPDGPIMAVPVERASSWRSGTPTNEVTPQTAEHVTWKHGAARRSEV